MGSLCQRPLKGSGCLGSFMAPALVFYLWLVYVRYSFAGCAKQVGSKWLNILFGLYLKQLDV